MIQQVTLFLTLSVASKAFALHECALYITVIRTRNSVAETIQDMATLLAHPGLIHKDSLLNYLFNYFERVTVVYTYIHACVFS